MFSLQRDDDTICAISTAPGSGGIAVLRVSGKDSLKVARVLCPFLPDVPESHRVYYGFLQSAQHRQKMDEVLVSYFAEKRSFTGEETIEISCHGGRFLSSLILKELVEAGARVAEPGEFTYRAFMNQRLDLVQAEGVLELINSKTSFASSLALRQLEGGFSKELLEIKEMLTQILAHLEANIDFSSEDIEIASPAELLKLSQSAFNKIETLLKAYRIGKMVKEGLTTILVGEPNSGKSSLLNALMKEERAIVTEIPGTTRDLIEGQIEVSGVSVRLIDSAGFRDTEDLIESIGINKMKEVVLKSDYVFWVIDPLSTLTGSKAHLLDALRLHMRLEQLFIIISKNDLLDDSGRLEMENWLQQNLSDEIYQTLSASHRIFYLSSKTGEGLPKLMEALEGLVEDMSETQSSGLVNARHFELLKVAHLAVNKTSDLLVAEESPDFVALELQAALYAVMEILGERFDDEVMDKVFREFCLGK